MTMKDIADKLGLSINAVSLALNDREGVGADTRKQVLDTAEQLGYLDQSPKYIKTYSNKYICTLLKHRYFRDFKFYGRILLGIEEEAKKSGYDVIMNSFEKEEIPACVKSKKVSGIIVVGKIEDDFLTRLKEYKLPIVLVDYVSFKEPTSCIVSDSRLGAYKLTDKILKKGIKKIGYFGDIKYAPSTLDRYLGYLEAMQKNLNLGSFHDSIEYVNRFSVLDNVEDYVIRQDAEGMYEAFSQIEERPDVLFCSNDELAIFLMKTLQSKGLSIPEDIGIVGFDDIESGMVVSPALTTVHVPKKLMGQKATQRLLAQIAHPTEDVEKVVMGVEVVVRESV